MIYKEVESTNNQMTTTERNPLLIAIQRLIDTAIAQDAAHHIAWKEAIEIARVKVAKVGDKLLLFDGTVVVVVKGWHGKGGCWLTVARPLNMETVACRDIELWEIADIAYTPILGRGKPQANQ